MILPEETIMHLDDLQQNLDLVSEFDVKVYNTRQCRIWHGCSLSNCEHW
jgi:hypothetical protein